jgi:hypothetical protein
MLVNSEDQSVNKLIISLLNKKTSERKCSLHQLKMEEIFMDFNWVNI